MCENEDNVNVKKGVYAMGRPTSIDEVRDYLQMWERIYKRAVNKSTKGGNPAAEEGLYLVRNILEYISEGWYTSEGEE